MKIQNRFKRTEDTTFLKTSVKNFQNGVFWVILQILEKYFMELFSITKVINSRNYSPILYRSNYHM